MTLVRVAALDDLSPGRRKNVQRAMVVLVVVIAAATVVHVLHSTVDLGGTVLAGFAADWDYNVVILAAAVFCLGRGYLVAEERGVWIMLGAALLVWAGGDICYSSLSRPSVPSAADALYLAFYPLAYLSLLLFVRSRVRAMEASYWLEGAIEGLTVAALAAALLDAPIFDTCCGSGGAPAAVINITYPLADLALLTLVAVAFALSGWRPDRSLVLLGAGLVVVAAADTWYVYSRATGLYVDGHPLDSLWPVGALLLALAAWQPRPRRRLRRLEGWPLLVVPLVCALTALGLLVYDHFYRLNGAAIALATCTLVVALGRLALSFGDQLGILRSNRRQALHDSLTGLANRRLLLDDLSSELARARPSAPLILAMFDLDWFKRYNDTYGHLAGDALLSHVARHLATTLGRDDRAYRLGGDEFCALLHPRETGDTHDLVPRAAAALSARGRGFVLGCSYGSVRLPDERADVSEALQLADQRMYAYKEKARLPEDERTPYAIAQLLDEPPPEPVIGSRLPAVPELVVGVATRLGMPATEIGLAGRAAQLRDVGKVAIPDTILEKQRPLDDHELRYLRLHPAIGERLIVRALMMRDVAGLVRSSHERYDGGGHPDGLAGEAIPLGARIIHACDALAALASGASPEATTPVESALAVIRRDAGTRFDPAIVEALDAQVDELRSSPTWVDRGKVDQQARVPFAVETNPPVSEASADAGEDRR